MRKMQLTRYVEQLADDFERGEHVQAAGEAEKETTAEPNGEPDFWEAARRSAERVKDMPEWTQAGIVLSDNFEGGKRKKEPT